MAALNGAWEVLRCPKKRQDYNQSLQAQALKRQAEEKKKHFINSIAVKQKQNHEQREAHKVSATAKQKARSTTETKESVSEKKAANGSSFVYVCLTNQKKAIVVKSSSRKSLHRKFERHNFVSAKHADAVASEFANRVENWCVETLCMNKIAQLEEFMMQQDIEKPAKRVSKVFLQEYIEEAFYNKSCGKLESFLRTAYQDSTGASSTPEGNTSYQEGIVVDKYTNKFMATFKISKEHGSICKIFDNREDAEFWYDSISSLHQKQRLVGNISLLRQACATRKATAEAMSRIMSENVSVAAEASKTFARDMAMGTDMSGIHFLADKSLKKNDLPQAEVRIHRLMSERLSTLVEGQKLEGRLLGKYHDSTGWRATICILLGDSYSLADVDQFAKTSCLSVVGVIGSSNDLKPSVQAFDALKALASECTIPIYLHFARIQGQVKLSAFQLAAKENGGVAEVQVNFIVRKLQQEEFRVIGSAAESSQVQVGIEVSR
ncbi:unnamed protein product [Durusdinium trenchii]|uniref:PH domain-containing protein n=1 Tax=Durusdinium trenchii TaxID=1381693 RepID=A0ABP0SU49_9DINO